MLAFFQNGEQLLVIPQSPPDWLAVEYCLWEIDVRGSKCVGKSILQADAISAGANDVLSRLLRKVWLMFLPSVYYLKHI